MANENKTSQQHNNSNKASNKSTNNESTKSASTGATSAPLSLDSIINFDKVFDKVPDYVDQLITQVFQQVEPKVREFAMDYTNRVVGKGSQIPSQLVSTVRRNPLYAIGAVVLVLGGLGLVMGEHSIGGSKTSAKDLH
jgi:hypothetical protein